MEGKLRKTRQIHKMQIKAMLKAEYKFDIKTMQQTSSSNVNN